MNQVSTHQCDDLHETPEGEEYSEQHLGGYFAKQRSLYSRCMCRDEADWMYRVEVKAAIGGVCRDLTRLTVRAL